MKIRSVDAIELAIPFDRAGGGAGLGGGGWPALDHCLVKITTEEGLTGWGDGFAYRCRASVAAVIRDMAAPLLIGQDASDIRGIHHRLQQALHLFGRYGITMFAISGIDIALWDLAARRAGLPLSMLLGGPAGGAIEAYASLFILRDRALVEADVARALKEDYRKIKLHEVDPAIIAAARRAAGPAISLMVDVNCPWTVGEAIAMAEAMRDSKVDWLEEPVFPPEDMASLARVRLDGGIPVAAGENWCTTHQFKAALEAGAIDFAQPSVTKVGGITEYLAITALCETAAVPVKAHSPYFGPGFLASLHLARALRGQDLVEHFYIQPEACLFGGITRPTGGHFMVPDVPGIGPEPDPAVIERYRV